MTLSKTKIRLQNVTKRYPLWRRPSDIMRNLSINEITDEAQWPKDVRYVDALKNINLEISEGERVALVGRNGAGKSTLLKLLSNGSRSTFGEVSVSGEVYTLAGGTVGFDPYASPNENAVRFLGQAGITGTALEEKVAGIREFVELGQYFDQPVRTLSAGMRARTEFAVGTAIAAETLLIDEVMGAGDMYWSERCAQRVEEMCQEGRTVLFVSHAAGAVLRYCTRAIWIEKGQIVTDGPAEQVVTAYETFLEHLAWQSLDQDDLSTDYTSMFGETLFAPLPDMNEGKPVLRWPGRADVQFTGVWFNDSSETTLEVVQDQPLNIKLNIKFNKSGTYELRYQVAVWTESGDHIGVFCNVLDEVSGKEGEQRSVYATMDASSLAIGKYELSLSLFDLDDDGFARDEQKCRLDVLYKSWELKVVAGEGSFGELMSGFFSVPATEAGSGSSDI